MNSKSILTAVGVAMIGFSASAMSAETESLDGLAPQVMVIEHRGAEAVSPLGGIGQPDDPSFNNATDE